MKFISLECGPIMIKTDLCSEKVVKKMIKKTPPFFVEFLDVNKNDNFGLKSIS